MEEVVEDNTDHIKVVVRCRPINPCERRAGLNKIVQTFRSKKCLKIQNSMDNLTLGQSGKTKLFTFDAVFGTEATQSELYESSVRPMVNQMFEGYNVTIFAYGQTGTGKTFTMEGNHRERGIMQNAFSQIFEFVRKNERYSCTVECSYLEIYQGKIRDLLNSSRPIDVTSKLTLPCKGLRSVTCHCEEDMENCRRIGYTSRMTASTYWNEYSSRSHAIFVVTFTMVNNETREVKIQSKLNLVDLAGSESLQRSNATDVRLKECCDINLSLLAVNKVISSSMTGKTYIPYRDSLLTMLLQDSFGGESTKTLMIANIGPTAISYKETLTTLEYAHKAKKIKNAPKARSQNKSPQQKYKETLEELNLWKKRLAKAKERERILDTTTRRIMKEAVTGLLELKGLDLDVKNLSAESFERNFRFPKDPEDDLDYIPVREKSCTY